MNTIFTTVSSKGQVVIPAELREHLKLKAGTRVAIQRNNGYLVLQPVTPDFVDRVAGSYKGKSSMVEAREREHRIER